MGFFKRLFGSGDGERNGDDAADAPDDEAPAVDPSPVAAPVAAPATTESPYRGSAFVEVKRELPKAPSKQPVPIWDSWTEVFSIELGDQLPLASMAYCGENGEHYLVRRVQFADGGVIVDWELALPNRKALSDHLACRVEDRILVPRATGVVAVHVVTGEPCWELPHPASLVERPKRFADGDLLLAFADRSWMRVAPRDGAFREEGTVRSERELRDVAKDCRDIGPRLSSSVTYGGTRVTAASSGIEVRSAERGVPEPRGPTTGDYPIDGWAPKKWVALTSDRLAILLSRTWNDRTRFAVGVFEPTSLEPTRLIELGDVVWHSNADARLIDDLLVIETDALADKSTDYHRRVFVVDAHAGCVLGSFVDGPPSLLFDDKGRQVWKAAM